MVQCALNGGYGRNDHPEVPVTLEQIVADAVACRDAGAGSVHLHPRRPGDGRESLSAAVHDPVVEAVRAAAGDLEVSCSTAEHIDVGDAADRVAAIRAWQCPPDLVSLNLAEDGAIELGAALVERGIGIEAGLFTLADADRLLAAPWARDVRRVLVETIFEHDDAQAVALARAIDERVRELGRQRLWHGDGRANWAVVDAGLDAGQDVRVGLEDTLVGREGGRAPGNAGQVADVVARGMSEHVEFLRRGYAALERGDLETFKALARMRLDPEFEFHLVWDGRVLKGYEGTLEWLSDTRETWENYSQEIVEIVDLGADVVVVLRISARGSGSGVPVAQEVGVVWTFDGDRAVRARSFTSGAAALESVPSVSRGA